MCIITLETNTKEHEILKAYLEQNASETLADKINNGVKIVKDGKTLLNKKTLDTFLSFAYEEAKNQAEKCAKFAAVADNVVFGWLIHYFEEDSIEGILYNEDGTEYKPTPKKTTTTQNIKPETKSPVKKQNEIISMFDGMEDIFMTTNNEIKEKDESPKNPLDELKSNILTFPSGDCLYIGYENGIIYAGAMTNTGILRQYEFEYEFDLSVEKNIQDIYDYILENNPLYALVIDKATGEVIDDKFDFDIEIAAKLYDIFGNDLEGW